MKKKKKKVSNPIFKIDPNCNACGSSLETGYVIPALIDPAVKKVSTVCIGCWNKQRQADFDFLQQTIFGTPISKKKNSINTFDDLAKKVGKLGKQKRSKK